MTLAGAITIAALAFIAGTLGAWLVWTQLRDSKRRLEARQRLGLFGDFPHVPAEAQFGDARMRAGSGNANAADAQSMSLTHRGEAV